MKVIKTIDYFGALANFKAFMEQILLIHKGIWRLRDRHYFLAEHYDRRSEETKSYRALWEFIERVSDQPGSVKYWGVKAGIIYALEKFPNKTTVQFIDGVNGEGFLRSLDDSLDMGEDLVAFINFFEDQLNSELLPNRVSQESTTKENKSRAKRSKGRRGPNLDTQEKIRNLIEIRSNAIKNHKKIPGWSVSCNMAGIDHKTALRYLRTLREKWGDYTYNLNWEIDRIGESGEY